MRLASYIPAWLHDSLEYTTTIEVSIRAGNFTECSSVAYSQEKDLCYGNNVLCYMCIAHTYSLWQILLYIPCTCFVFVESDIQCVWRTSECLPQYIVLHAVHCPSCIPGM